MDKKQKFKRGDVVHIAADLGQYMSHFTADKDAIIMGSYRDQFGGNNVSSYTVMFCDNGRTSSWYEEHQLTLIRHGGNEEIEKVSAERKAREKCETDMSWIVSNWPKIREQVPGATMGELMRRIGITNPWGTQGEGVTYYANARGTFYLLDPVLKTRSVHEVERFLSALPNAQAMARPDTTYTK